MPNTVTIDAALLRVGMPESMLGLCWAVDVSFAREWLQARADGSVQVVEARDRGVSVPVTRGVAVIPVQGVLSQRGGMCALGCTDISAALAQAMADPNVGGILLDIDSPGGGVFGVDELAAEIMSARERKPIVAYANSRAASAAYWLASAASEISVTPGGEVGSIGIYVVHQAQEASGASIVSAGKYKVEAHPYAPLSDEARASLQQKVDDHYGRFITRVASGRNVPEATVRDGYGEGRMLTAKRALAEGMVDHVETFGEALGRLAARVASPASGLAAQEQEPERLAQVRRMRLDLESSYIGGMS